MRETLEPCAYCGNSDSSLFGLKNGAFYCRLCLPFQVTPIERETTLQPKRKVLLQLGYSLTQEQHEISERMVIHVYNRHDVMLNAVTGSGKTEIVYKAIQMTIESGGRVAFVIPRRDVVKEIFPRIKQAFPTVKVVEVYGGHHEDLLADIVVLTSHQIFRYKHYFDLIVFDEVDAFPYEGNRVLEAMVIRARRGSIIYMSATFTTKQLLLFKKQGGKIEHLYARHHGQPLPSLTIVRTWTLMHVIGTILLLLKWKKEKVPCILFVPTVKIGNQLAWLCDVLPGGAWVHASSNDRDERIEMFKRGKLHFLMSTSILERGITLKGLQVIIMHADHTLMDEKTIVQMAGRVGRKRDSPGGNVYVFCQTLTGAIQASQRRIRTANEHVFGVS